MNKTAYLQTQTHLQSLAQIVKDMPLYDFIKAINRAETTGPIVDPTLYREGSENLTKIKRLAQALLPFQKAAKDTLK